ncbi:DUF6285 domain-containing protein [Nocardia sp. NPDC048505]|uniref:DUF6285 domain-containing protein n=1 Tax=unclassified Nocardia TaxID=2637762 RepID=UPI0033DBD3F9
MPQDLPAADDLVDVVAAYLSEHARGPGGPAAARLLRMARGLPVGRLPVLRTVARYLSDQPETPENRLAADLLRIAAREIDMGPGIRRGDAHRLRRLLGTDGSYPELVQQLAHRLRDPAPLPDWERTLAYLRAAAAERLRIADPDHTRTEG